jgi:small-conductance mechanosensitive channel
MKITKKYIKTILLVFVFLFGQMLGILALSPQASAATSLWDKQLGLGGDESGVIGQEGFSKGATQTDDIRTVIGRIIRVVLSFLGIIFIVLMLIAGFKWMNSQGDEGKISEAKSTITAAVIGLLIVMASYAITVLVLNYVYNATP